MKNIFGLVILLIAPISFAGEYSIYQLQFNQMSNEEAWESDLFAKRVQNSWVIPGTSTYIKLSGTCKDSNELVLEKPFKQCLEWKVSGPGVDTKVFGYKIQASNYATAAGVDSEPVCSSYDLIESVQVDGQLPKSFSVDFFIKVPGKGSYNWDKDLLLGSRNYGIPNCH